MFVAAMGKDGKVLTVSILKFQKRNRSAYNENKIRHVFATSAEMINTEQDDETMESNGKKIITPVPTSDSAASSSAVWSRAAILFAALCLIKLVMLWSLRKHLF